MIRQTTSDNSCDARTTAHSTLVKEGFSPWGKDAWVRDEEGCGTCYDTPWALAEAGFPVLKSEMINRVVYAEAALWGATPSLLDRAGPAARDIAAIAEEVDFILDGMHDVRRAASA